MSQPEPPSTESGPPEDNPHSPSGPVDHHSADNPAHRHAADPGADAREVWPLARILATIAVGSGDWTWDEEFAQLDHDHPDRLAALQQDIAENGITTPVLIGNDGRLWDGHHRLRIAARLDIEQVPVQIAQPATNEAADEDTYVSVTDRPGHPDQALITTPHYYLDTQAWTVELGVDHDDLARLRQAIDAYTTGPGVCGEECSEQHTHQPGRCAAEPDDTDVTEAEFDHMMAEGTPVEIVTSPPAGVATHACDNCLGIDPGTCLFNPERQNHKAQTPNRPVGDEPGREQLRQQYATAARTVRLRLGPNAIAMAQRGETVPLSLGESVDLADAVMAVRDTQLQQAEAEAARLRAELEQERAFVDEEIARWKAALAEVRDTLTAAGHGRAEITDWPDVLPTLEELTADRDRLRARVQAIADEARGGIRDWLLDALTGLDDARVPSTAERAEQAEAEAARLRAELAARDEADSADAAAGSYAHRAEHTEAALNRVRALHARLHVRTPNTGTCEHCSENDYPDYAVPWPCPTIRALEGADGPPPIADGTTNLTTYDKDTDQ